MHISIYTALLLLTYAFSAIFYKPSLTHHTLFTAATHCKLSRSAADRAWLGQCVTVELQQYIHSSGERDEKTRGRGLRQLHPQPTLCICVCVRECVRDREFNCPLLVLIWHTLACVGESCVCVLQVTVHSSLPRSLPISPCVRELTDTPYRPNGGLAEEDGSSQRLPGGSAAGKHSFLPPSEEESEIEINISALPLHVNSQTGRHTFSWSLLHTHKHLLAVLVKSVASKNII